MRQPYTQLYVHLVWSTWDRMPLIRPNFEQQLYDAIAAKCLELKSPAYTIGGIENHVHVLARFHQTIAISRLVQEIKGSSSHYVNHVIRTNDYFKWQGGYGAFTIRKSEIESVTQYVLRQKEHHRSGHLLDEFEPSFQIPLSSG